MPFKEIKHYTVNKENADIVTFNLALFSNDKPHKSWVYVGINRFWKLTEIKSAKKLLETKFVGYKLKYGRRCEVGTVGYGMANLELNVYLTVARKEVGDVLSWLDKHPKNIGWSSKIDSILLSNSLKKTIKKG